MENMVPKPLRAGSSLGVLRGCGISWGVPNDEAFPRAQATCSLICHLDVGLHSTLPGCVSSVDWVQPPIPGFRSWALLKQNKRAYFRAIIYEVKSLSNCLKFFGLMTFASSLETLAFQKWHQTQNVSRPPPGGDLIFSEQQGGRGQLGQFVQSLSSWWRAFASQE